MSQLIISDLKFLEIEFPSNSEVKGGTDSTTTTSAKRVSAKVVAAVDADVKAKLEINGLNYKFSGGSAGAAAGAAAGSTEGPVKVNVKVKAEVKLS